MKKIIISVLFLLSAIGLSAENGYDKLERNLNGVGGIQAGWFTVFCNLDVNFSNMRFTRFLEDSKFAMTIDDTSVKFSPTEFSMKYVPRVSSKTEYLTVHYTLEQTSKHKGAYETDDGKTALIKRVEITGTPELILNLFLYYWQYKMNVEDNKDGELANYNVMGDRVSLVRLNRNSSKITITPKEFDYKESFGIE